MELSPLRGEGKPFDGYECVFEVFVAAMQTRIATALRQPLTPAVIPAWNGTSTRYIDPKLALVPDLCCETIG
jgi:hypothetical protein